MGYVGGGEKEDKNTANGAVFWVQFYLVSSEEVAGYSEFWRTKIRGNIERDKRNTEKLESEGWLVLRFWESEINANLENCVEKIIQSYSQQSKNAV